MDLKPAITKLFEIYKQINESQEVQPGFGVYQERYRTKSGKTAVIFCILSPPASRTKAKRKIYDKIIEKSIGKNKLIDPTEFQDIRKYLNSIFVNA